MPDALQDTAYLEAPETPLAQAEITAAVLPAAVRQPSVRIEISSEPSSSKDVASVSNIYPFREFVSPDLTFALRALDALLAVLDAGVIALEDGDLPLADDCIQRAAAGLPDLFLCSSLGDGFAATIVGVHYAITNAKEMLTADQLLEIRLALRRLKTEPFIRHEHAIERLMKLEEAGLVVDPPIQVLPSEAAE
jgi:hypothetical protein